MDWGAAVLTSFVPSLSSYPGLLRLSHLSTASPALFPELEAVRAATAAAMLCTPCCHSNL